jgi:hypothetical protein
MKVIVVLLLLFGTGCSSKIYLSSYGYVVGVYKDYVEVRIPCSNVRRPDCGAYLKIDREEMGDVSFGQRVVLE